MACGLSVVELYGAQLLDERILPNSMANRDLTSELCHLGHQLRITNGMYRKRDESEGEDKLQKYPSYGVPLHRSPAVLAALSSIATEDQRKTEVEERRSEPGSNRCKEEGATSKKQPDSDQPKPKLEKQFPERRKISSEKQFQRPKPYIKRKNPFHNINSMGMHYNPSWPSCMLASSAPGEIEPINKSFSAPALSPRPNLPLSQQNQAFGDRMHALAIRKLSKLYTNPKVTRVTFSSAPKTTVTSAFRGNRPLAPASRSQQRDNFRKLMLPRPDKSSFSKRDIALQRLIADSLAANGICVIDGLLGGTLAGRIKEEVLHLHDQDNIVKGELVVPRRDETATRGDVITWVDGTEPHCKNIGLLCQKMDKIVSRGTGVTPGYQICGGTKVMAARYPGGGARYKLHVDNPSKDGRCLTCIYYLNESWNTETMGGLLRIHAQTRGQTSNIAPLFDRIAIFYSDGRNPHEVLPCYADRYAVTLWYFDRDERAKALERMDSMSQSTSFQANEANMPFKGTKTPNY